MVPASHQYTVITAANRTEGMNKIKAEMPAYVIEIKILLALLHNITSRISTLIASI